MIYLEHSGGSGYDGVGAGRFGEGNGTGDGNNVTVL